MGRGEASLRRQVLIKMLLGRAHGGILILGFSKRRQGTNGKNQRDQKHARGGLSANWMIRKLLHILAEE